MECKRCLCVCFWITLLVCRPCVLFVETIYDLYIYRRDNLTIPEVYYFAVGTKNGVTIGLEGACKGEQRRLKMPLSKWNKDGNISLPAFSSFLMFTNMSKKNGWFYLQNIGDYTYKAVYIWTFVSSANDTTIVYDALVRDHVPVENKHRLMEFWSMDWSSDGFVDLEEVCYI